MKTSKRLKDISNVLKQRQILKNNELSKMLLNNGLYEQAAKLQAPITETITKTSEDTQKEIKLVKEAIQDAKSENKDNSNIPTILSPEDIEAIDIINGSKNATFRPNNNTLLYNDENDNASVYSIGSNAKKIFIVKDNKMIDTRGEIIVISSKGLAKLLFQNDPSIDDITKEDVEEYKNILMKYGYRITTSNKREIVKKMKEGEGIPPVETEIVTIPSDEDNLRQDLVLNLAAAKSGNSNVFNHINAIMKYMMEKKILSGKEYRAILKEYFHV
jgi:hypothetical protein